MALYAYDPTVHPLDQSSPVGPVGAWLGWGSFHAFGYAGYLFPVLLALYGVSAFVRPRVAHGWQAGVGLLILLVSATGVLARASDTLAEYRLHKGGVVGWAVSEGLMVSIGTVGTWIILLALIPVGVLFVTRIPYSVLSRALRARFGRLRRPDARKGRPGPASADLPLMAAVPPGGWPAGDQVAAPPALVVKEQPKVKSGLADKGLAWQETFDSARAARRRSSAAAACSRRRRLLAPAQREEWKPRADAQRSSTTSGWTAHIVQASPGP